MTERFSRKVLVTLVTALAAGAGPAVAQEDATRVEPEAYIGLWYEVARTPAPFQQQCEGGVTAHYEAIDAETVRVLNRCDTAGGTASRTEGTAVEVGEDFRRFSVQFGMTPDDKSVNYVVEAVGPVEDGRHSWAAVSDGEGGIGWILAPRPDLDEAAQHKARAALAEAGVDVSQLRDTAQPPDNYDPQRQ